MKTLLLCDMENIKETSTICAKNNLCLNADSFRHYDLLNSQPHLLKEYLMDYKNVEICSFHGPITDMIFENGYIELAKRKFEFAYTISQKINCKNIVLHNGYVPQTGSPESWVNSATELWGKFLLHKDTETIFYLENNLENNPDVIINLIENVGRNNLKMCLDIGHANVFSDMEIPKWIEISHKYIGFVHLHNNNGKIDRHNGLGNGTINMLEACNALEQYCPDAIWALETVDLEESVEWLKNNGFY